MKSRNLLSNTGRITAYTCFAIGTIIFASHYHTSVDALIDLALWFILISFWINMFLLVLLLIQSIRNKEIRKENLTTCLIMLLNIPVTILYYWTTLNF